MMTLTTSEAPNAEDEALGPCSVCGGWKSEHEGRIHAYTNVGGTLVTQAEVEKAKQRNKPLVIAAPHSQVMNRVVEVLANKGIFDTEDLMYITGVKGQPDGDGS